LGLSRRKQMGILSFYAGVVVGLVIAVAVTAFL
jgi:hypothetical protein